MERTRPQLGPEQTQAVLRRAAELDRNHAEAVKTPTLLRAEHEPRIDAGELERIASEAGLSPEAIHRAIVELQGGALDKGAPPRPIEKLVAGESSTARAYIDAPVADVERRLANALRTSGLEPVSKKAHAMRWEPSSRIGHTLGRLVDHRGTGAYIGAAVDSSVHAAPDSKTSVELRGDAGNVLAPIATVTGLALAPFAAIALLVVLGLGVRWGFSGQHALAALMIAVSWLLLTFAVSRGVARGRVRKLRRRLEKTLSQVAAGDPPGVH